VTRLRDVPRSAGALTTSMLLAIIEAHCPFAAGQLLKASR
jgi:hypothetical protein